MRFAPKRRETPQRIDKDMTIMKERVRKACAHARWGRSPWRIEKEQLQEGGPTLQNRNGSARPGEPLSVPDSYKQNSMLRVAITEKPARKSNEIVDAHVPALDSSPSDDFPDAEAIREAADKLKMVSDATRLTILLILKRHDRNVTELCSDLGSESQPAVSHHLALLRHGRLVQPRREGKNNFYGLTEDGRRLAVLIENIVVPDNVADEQVIREAVSKLDMVSDATRLTILLILRRNDRNVTELCSDLGSESQPAVSHHLALLRHGRLVQPRREGKNNFYGLIEDGRRLAVLIESIV